MERETGDRLLRALGADPPVFRAVYRAQSLMLRRSARIIKSRSETRLSSLALLGLFALAFGLGGAVAVLSPLWVFGAGVAITLDCLVLAMIVLGDYAGALVDPAERLVLAAHPHDERSLLLARAAAAGRGLGLLSLPLFLPPAIALCFWVGPGAGAVFLLGAAAAALTVCLGGMLAAVLLIRTGGRRAMERFLPWAQVVAQLSFMAPAVAGMGRQLKPSGAVQEAIAWILPPFWFTAPLELIGGRAGWPAAVRLALAAGCVAAVVVAGGRLAAGLGRGLLEPETAPARRRPAAQDRRFLPRHEGLRLLKLLRLHLRADWRNRAQLFLLPVMGVLMPLIYFRDSGTATATIGRPVLLWMYGSLLFIGCTGLTSSADPHRLWWLLLSPIDRTRFSLATISALRMLLLLPLSAAMAARIDLVAPGPWPQRLPEVLGLVLYGDLLLIVGKIVHPAFPFSQPANREGGGSADGVAVALLGGVIGGLGLLGLRLFWNFGPIGAWALAALALLLHLPAWLIARRRAAQAARKLEIGWV